MGSTERRLRKLEAVHATGATGKTPAENDSSYRAMWEMELEWTALELVRGREPYFTLDETGAFWTVDGQFAVSPDRLDMRGLFRSDPGPEAQAILSARWERFLEEDEQASDTLESLRALAESAIVPVDYKMPLYRWHDLGEVNDRMGNSDLGSVFADAEDRERVRRMVYVLAHVPDALALLCFVTRRRDVFADAEGATRIDSPGQREADQGSMPAWEKGAQANHTTYHRRTIA